mmetsp:Transcript_7592/g.13959  ORF Transcript_7592/g.13959 Transcript_7592/m.13959 type:complete len:799 (+) Transcript_7592:279-2675(+)
MSFTTPKLEKSNFQNAARHLSREISPIANRSAQMSWADVVASEPPSTAWADMMDDETSLQVEMDHENHHEQREKSTPLNGQKCILFTANVDEEQVTLTYNEVQALLKQRSTNNVSATTRRTKGSRTKGSRKARKSKKRKGRRKATITDSSDSDVSASEASTSGTTSDSSISESSTVAESSNSDDSSSDNDNSSSSSEDSLSQSTKAQRHSLTKLLRKLKTPKADNWSKISSRIALAVKYLMNQSLMDNYENLLTMFREQLLAYNISRPLLDRLVKCPSSSPKWLGNCVRQVVREWIHKADQKIRVDLLEIAFPPRSEEHNGFTILKRIRSWAKAMSQHQSVAIARAYNSFKPFEGETYSNMYLRFQTLCLKRHSKSHRRDKENTELFLAILCDFRPNAYKHIATMGNKTKSKLTMAKLRLVMIDLDQSEGRTGQKQRQPRAFTAQGATPSPLHKLPKPPNGRAQGGSQGGRSKTKSETSAKCTKCGRGHSNRNCTLSVDFECHKCKAHEATGNRRHMPHLCMRYPTNPTQPKDANAKKKQKKVSFDRADAEAHNCEDQEEESTLLDQDEHFMFLGCTNSGLQPKTVHLTTRAGTIAHQTIIDTGANISATYKRELFASYEAYDKPRIIKGLGQASSLGSGTINLLIRDSQQHVHQFHIEGVELIPELHSTRKTLLCPTSVFSLHLRIITGLDKHYLEAVDGAVTFPLHFTSQRLLAIPSVEPMVHFGLADRKQPAVDFESWHARLGHQSTRVLKRYSTANDGVPYIPSGAQVDNCIGCIKGKLNKRSIKSTGGNPFPT